MPPGSAEPGPWRSSRTPYIIPICEAIASPRYGRIVVVMGSQLGKTEMLVNTLGWRCDDDPLPAMYIGPTQKQVESMSSDRVMKMLRSTPALWEKLEKGKRNKISEKYIGGIRLGFAWAGSATELSSHPAGLVVVDERDRMDSNAGGEGDPVELADARRATFPGGKLIVVSTPTSGAADLVAGTGAIEHFKIGDAESIASPVWRLWQEGTRHEWAWPCPDCGEYFVPRRKLLVWPDGSTPFKAMREARLVCPACGSMIDDQHRPAMNARGRFVAPGQSVDRDGNVTGEPPDSDCASYWVSGLASPWRSFGHRARALVTATEGRDAERIKAVVNTGFGELWAPTGSAPRWESVVKLRADVQQGLVPDWAHVLTCGVDVQKNRLVYAVRAWGAGYSSHLVEHGELWGETAYADVWQSLARLLDRDFGGHSILRMVIDSGYKPGEADRNDHAVYLFARQYKGRVLAAKGHETLAKPFNMSLIDVSFRGKLLKKGLELWHYNSDYFKTWVHGRLEWPADQPGRWQINRDATDDYCMQIVAEARIAKSSGHEWVKLRRDNHFLDAEVLNTLGAHVIGLHNLGKALPQPAKEPQQPKRSYLDVPDNWIN